MSKFIVFFLAGCAALTYSVHAWGAETINTHETEKYFFKDNTAERFEGQFEYTYYLDIDTHQLVRTRIYDYRSKKILPDETVYIVQKDLNSHPQNASRFGLPKTIRAFAQTGPDAVELIQIDDDEVYTSTSTNNSLVVSRAKRI